MNWKTVTFIFTLGLAISHVALADPMSRSRAFSVLGIPPGSSEDSIRRRYKSLVRSLHPDFNGGVADPKNRLGEVNAAYEFLFPKPASNGTNDEQSTNDRNQGRSSGRDGFRHRGGKRGKFYKEESTNGRNQGHSSSGDGFRHQGGKRGKFYKEETSSGYEPPPDLSRAAQLVYSAFASRAGRAQANANLHTIRRFETAYQTDAFVIFAESAGMIVAINHASSLLLFENNYQIQALERILSVIHGKIPFPFTKILQFKNDFQTQALDIVVKTMGKNTEPFLDDILLFSNQGMVDRLRNFADQPTSIGSSLKDVLNGEVDQLKAKFSQEVQIEYWDGIEARLRLITSEPLAKRALWECINSHLEILTAQPISNRRLIDISEQLGLPAASIFNAIASYKVLKSLHSERDRMKTGQDLLASRFVSTSSYQLELVEKSLGENSDWIAQLQMTPKELITFLAESGINKLLVRRILSNNLFRFEKLDHFIELFIFQTVSPKVAALEIWTTIVEPFLRLNPGPDLVNEVLFNFQANIPGIALKPLIQYVLDRAKDLDSLYQIPVSDDVLNELSLLNMYNIKQKAYGATWVQRNVFNTQRSNSRTTLKNSCFKLSMKPE